MNADDRAKAEEPARSLNEQAPESTVQTGRLRRRVGDRAADRESVKQATAAALKSNSDAHARTAAALRRAAVAHREVAKRIELIGDHDKADEHRASADADDEAAQQHDLAAKPQRATAQE